MIPDSKTKLNNKPGKEIIIINNGVLLSLQKF
jgi:hypothetical protein